MLEARRKLKQQLQQEFPGLTISVRKVPTKFDPLTEVRIRHPYGTDEATKVISRGRAVDLLDRYGLIGVVEDRDHINWE